MESLKGIQNQLFLAIEHSNTDNCDEVKHILSEHPELLNLKRTDDVAEEVSTPLIEACRQGLYEVAKILLDKGADVSATGNIRPFHGSRVAYPLVMGSSGAEFGAMDGVFPLFAVVASIFTRLNIVKALLSAGADVNQRTAIGQTTLHVVCSTDSDGGNQAVEFSLNDDDYRQNDIIGINMEPIKILLDHGADVNICDDHGKSPLHHAAQNGNKYFAKILLEKGADVYLKDKAGLTALDYAAPQDKPLTVALIEKYNFPMEKIIQAYECVALNDPVTYSIDAELLRKATLLRKLHGIPKKVLPPLECYGFEREWQTIEELEEYGDDLSQLLRQCLLARERISMEIHFDLTLDGLPQNLDSRGGIDQNMKLLNSRMWYWLDRISYFGKYLHFADLMMTGDISLSSDLDLQWLLSNDVLVKFILVAIDSCCVIQNRLKSETKPGCVQEFIYVTEQILVVVGGVILHLMKRSDRKFRREFNHRIPKVLLNELLHRCPMVTAPSHGYVSPLIIILFKAPLEDMLYSYLTYLTGRCLMYNCQLAKMIVDSHQWDLNATDWYGNTILHTVISGYLLEIDRRGITSGQQQLLLMIAFEIVETFLNNGAYPHVRNKQGQYPCDIPQDIKFENISNPEEYLIPFKHLLEKFDSTLSLKYMAATKIVVSKIPYRGFLPESLVKFVDLH